MLVVRTRSALLANKLKARVVCGHMEKIVFLDRDAVRANVRRPEFAHEWREHARTEPAEVVARLQDATVAIVNKVGLGAEQLDQLPLLRLIAVAATGYNMVDLDVCRARGVAVCNVRDYAASSVTEHALMLMLLLRRRFTEYQNEVRAGAWQRAEQFCLFSHDIRDLNRSTLGIIGFGALGRSLAQLARSIGMTVLIAEHKQATTIRDGRTSFLELLVNSDVVSLHCPLTATTRDLIDGAELKLMKPGAILINTARGGLVNEAALLDALRAGTIAGAGIDVLSTEPPRGGNVLLSANLSNLIVTPHNAWASLEAMQALADQVIDNIEAFVRGSPRNIVA
jgi:glycerate dehydrogenase